MRTERPQSMNNHQRRPIALSLGMIAAGLLATAVLPMAVAFADEGIIVPDLTTLDPTGVTGDPPYSPEVITGTGDWSIYDLTTGSVKTPDFFTGTETHTVFGSFTNDILAASGANEGYSADLTNFGGGWENEWIDSPTDGNADLLVTPFGSFELFGTPDFFTI